MKNNNFISDRGKSFALIGCPLGHSMSEIIHKELFKISGTQAVYALKEIREEELDRTFESYLSRLDGFNVTIPYKTRIIDKLDCLSEKAELFGAVNTVSIKNGYVKGYNTDCIGFLRSLKAADIELCGRVLLCGAGGVSRMIAFEALAAGCDLTVAVRESSFEAARKIRSEAQKKTGRTFDIVMFDDIKNGFDLIVNGTPVGMYPKTEACPVSEDVIKSSKAVYDVIYNPIETRLVKYARKYSLKYSGGLAMLVLQAAAAQEIWNGTEFSDDDIKKVISITEGELLK